LLPFKHTELRKYDKPLLLQLLLLLIIEQQENYWNYLF